MNVLFFLTPKSEVTYISTDKTLRQALEIMEYHRYSCVPLISDSGKYVGTITEGDLLWQIKNEFELNLKSAETVAVLDIKRHFDYKPVSANAKIEDLVDKAMNQNFVPVIDDNDIFIGIVTRRDIIQYGYRGYLFRDHENFVNI